uniref:Uncharacterized protein n=1 Tax=Avena sativa TaxID=4498 RepID=A0ACD5Y3A4_AVESA
MGSWFSSPAPAGDLRRLFPKARLGHAMSKEMLASLDVGRAIVTIEELYAECIPWLVQGVLKHYNACTNPGAEFQCPTEMKADCTGFTQDLIWYHLNFSARRVDNQQETRLFFAELCYHIDSEKLNLEKCTILEKPLRSSCAFCPQESKIMHPSEEEFVCGKEGQQAEFFDMTHMLLWPWEACTGDLVL